MRKHIILCLALFLPLFAFNMKADENENFKIPLKSSNGKELCRGLDQLILECYYNGSIGFLLTNILADEGEITFILTNLSTGETWSNSFDSGSVSQVITTISGTAGYYEIIYLTETGDSYVGNFIL